MMMRKRLLSLFKAVAAGLAAVAGLDLAGFVHFMDDSVARWVVVIPTAAAAVLHTVVALGDILDDGVKNDSFWAVLLVGFLGVVSFGLVGCEASHYRADLSAPKYSVAIAADASDVLIDAADVEVVGRAFAPEFRGRILTDAGEIVVGEDGVVGDVVIDLRTEPTVYESIPVVDWK